MNMVETEEDERSLIVSYRAILFSFCQNRLCSENCCMMCFMCVVETVVEVAEIHSFWHCAQSSTVGSHSQVRYQFLPAD